MNELVTRALLPAGLRDALPPEAEQEAEIVWRIAQVFGTYGYRRVKPPMVEFEDSLLAGSQAALARQTFRLMDPDSQRMLALRADMTPQVARIAATRLKGDARPLRLCYAGQVMRVKGDTLRPERQFGQVGAELIGADEAQADSEIVVMAVDALSQIGAANLSVDLAIPYLVPAVIAAHPDPGPLVQEAIRVALEKRDAEALARGGRDAGALLAKLVAASGPVEKALPALKALDLPADAKREIARLEQAVALIRAARPELALTVDAVERRGFEYQKGLSFTVFARGVRGELGRGGRYLAGEDLMEGAGETATGVTLFTDTVLRALPFPAERQRVFVPADAEPGVAGALRAKGEIALRGFAAGADASAQAKALGCTHLWRDGAIVKLEG
jgi:ATP phosphoribosyltransferase regulatory subunit